MPRVLIIEDDEVVLKLLRITLERAGFDVDTATDGDAGMQCMSREPSDVVVTDIVMPGKQGLETIPELRLQWPNTRIIAISGGARLGVRGSIQLEAGGNLRIAKRLGADACFTKPVPHDELIGTIHGFFEEA